MCSKICFIGDIHGKNRNPLGRLYDYNEDLFYKLNWIIRYCNDNNINKIVHLGDIHDKTESSDEWKNKLIMTIRQFNGDFYSLIGNHDLPNNNEQLYSQTCLFNLELSGAIKILREPEIIDFGQIIPLSLDIQKAKKDLIKYYEESEAGSTCIFVGHNYYNFSLNLNAGFVDEDFAEIRSKIYMVLGHDHRQHEAVTTGNCTIFRPGSLMRTELSEETISMRPRILIYANDSLVSSWKYVEVPHRDINEIYDVGFYRSKKINTKYFKQTANALDNIDKYLKAQNVQIKCSDALKQLNCPIEEYEYLKAAYQMCSQEF